MVTQVIPDSNSTRMGKLELAKTPCHSGRVNNNGLTNWLMFRGSGEVSGLNFLLFLSRRIDFLNGKIGTTVYWLVLASVLVSSGNAVVRYLFDHSSNAWLELQWYLFAAVFLLCAGYTLLHNEHVRIDVISAGSRPRTRAWIDLLGGIFFLLPMAIIIMVLAWPVFMNPSRATRYRAMPAA